MFMIPEDPSRLTQLHSLHSPIPVLTNISCQQLPGEHVSRQRLWTHRHRPLTASAHTWFVGCELGRACHMPLSCHLWDPVQAWLAFEPNQAKKTVSTSKKVRERSIFWEYVIAPNKLVLKLTQKGQGGPYRLLFLTECMWVVTGHS